MKTMTIALLVFAMSGCTSVAYVENGANGSECENTVSINETGLKAVSICKGDSQSKE
ncbi:MAG: hypothetical protein ACK5MF_06425 [Vibrio sp.]|uniref:hypothetical protein n=1 Tax=Vibrio sp. TaxID=678 RepID=UPI003A8BED81